MAPPIRREFKMVQKCISYFLTDPFVDRVLERGRMSLKGACEFREQQKRSRFLQDRSSSLTSSCPLTSGVISLPPLVSSRPFRYQLSCHLVRHLLSSRPSSINIWCIFRFWCVFAFLFGACCGIPVSSLLRAR